MDRNGEKGRHIDLWMDGWVNGWINRKIDRWKVR
jgi:hypothetical protein